MKSQSPETPGETSSTAEIMVNIPSPDYREQDFSAYKFQGDYPCNSTLTKKREHLFRVHALVQIGKSLLKQLQVIQYLHHLPDTLS